MRAEESRPTPQFTFQAETKNTSFEKCGVAVILAPSKAHTDRQRCIYNDNIDNSRSKSQHNRAM